MCFDGQDGITQRQRLDPDCRRDIDVSPLAWLPALKDGLERIGIGWNESPAHEADDVIATLSSRAAGRPRAVLSMDKDFYQLIDERVTVVNTVRTRTRAVVDSSEVIGRYGVQPRQWWDFRALTGDPADAIPGVRGIGAIRAARLLADGLTLEQARQAGRLTGSAGATAQEAWAKVLARRALIRLRTDLDLPVMRASAAVTAEDLPIAARVVERLGLWR